MTTILHLSKSLILAAGSWIAQNPGQTALHGFSAAAFFSPGFIMAPLFTVVGLTGVGPGGATAASSIMSFFGNVVPGGLYATLQSAAMGGYGAPIVAGIVKGGAVAVSAGTAVWGWVRGG